MRRRLALIVATGLITTTAFAAADIPTRYSGSFPSGGRAVNLRGTFTGKSLALKYTVVRPDRTFGVTASYSCVATSSSTTRCDGTYNTDDGQFTGPGGIDITWKSGKPIRAHIDKPPGR
jgi:hypothetical protein